MASSITVWPERDGSFEELGALSKSPHTKGRSISMLAFLWDSLISGNSQILSKLLLSIPVPD